MNDRSHMTTAYDTAFNQMIALPLQRVVGKHLRFVDYFILWDGFDAESPNQSGGCQGVFLDFDGAAIELD